ncbi:Ig-like domain-containing protein [Bradymonas sediminis]|uniref:Uncharacterized protein n=1 Tax=Bradymonas sediminis TaxID=1548548 RepID=A0A2Z4FK44_9DELT|nr:Ig-like domain-containing protein [Bradymonas sediminis]AWV89322.1 hypothetical protein DN745_08215 [Bradymonas sediminis]TDP73497.1 Ig-like protein group 1 [Bradymonas sediminis]
MMSAKRIAALLAMGLFIANGFGCTDEPGETHQSGEVDPRPDDPTEAPENAKLMHVAPECSPAQDTCTVSVIMGTETELKAQLLDADGQPVKDALVTFESNFGTTELSISTSSAYTDSQGIARVTLRGGESAGTGQLSAKTDNAEIAPINWMIGVSSKDRANYVVDFTHTGTAQIKPIDVRLFPSTVTCESLLSNPNQTAVLESQGRVDSTGAMPTVMFPDRPNGQAYTVGAWARSLNYNGDVEVAYGCTDNNPAVENGVSVNVVVDLVDHLPNIVGTYNVVHDFDLVGALPPTVETVVSMIGRLANDPGSFIVGCGANPVDPQACPPDSPGLINLLVDFLPDGDFKDAIVGFMDSSIGNGVLRDAINSIAENWLENSAPSWVGNTVTITSDIYETLRHFTVEGTMRFNSAPVVSVDANGNLIGVLPSESGAQTWNDFVFNWSRGCDTAPDPAACATRRVGSTQLLIDPVTGVFDGTLLGSDKLQINQHTLTLNYGALLVGVLEKIVLPSIFGDDCGPNNNLACDSLELALGQLIKCEDLAESATGDTSGALYNVVENLCTNLLGEASDKLRDYASTNLVATGTDHFLIATPSEQHCTLIQPETYQGNWEGQPLPLVQYLGQDTPADLNCKWDVQIRFSDSTSAEVEGTFWGERNN